MTSYKPPGFFVLLYAVLFSLLFCSVALDLLAPPSSPLTLQLFIVAATLITGATAAIACIVHYYGRACTTVLGRAVFV